MFGKDNSDSLSEEQVKDVLRFRQQNLFIHNNELQKLFYGPWYEVKDKGKRDKLLQSGTETTYVGDDNYNKWHTTNSNKSGDVALNATDFGFHVWKDWFTQMTFAEIVSSLPAEELKVLRGIIGDSADPYAKSEEGDAQAIMLDTNWKEYKKRSGDRWTADDDKQQAYDLASARLAYYERPEIKADKSRVYRAELKAADEEIVKQGNPHTYGTGTPVKPVGTGFVRNNSQLIPYADKTSLMRLTYPVAKGRGLENLYWFMHDNGIGLVGPKSFEKYGRPFVDDFKGTSGLAPIYKLTEKGTESALGDITPNQLKQLKQEVNYSTFCKIVETAKSGEGKTQGSQMLSLVTVNSFNNGLPVDFYKTGDNFALKQDEWAAFDSKQRRAASKRYRLWDDNRQAIVARSQKGFENLINTFGIKKTGENSYKLTEAKKLVDYLKREITRRDLPDNIAEGLDWVEDAHGNEVLKYSIEALPNYQQLQAMLWAAARKEVLSPKLNGTDYINVSSAMFEKGLRKVENRDGKQFITSSALRFYIRGKDKTEGIEVYAPNFLKKDLDKFFDKNPHITRPSDKELFKYLNETEEGQKLLTAIGFRIPTQGMNSIDSMKIVPWSEDEMFLPAEMGNSIVLPSAIVTKTGGDFDVDKTGTYHYNFYVGKDGMPHLIKFVEDTTSDDGLKSLYKSRYTNKERSEIAAGRLLDDIFGEEGISETIPTEEEFIKENRGKSAWDLNSKEAIENKYFDTLHELVTLPENFDQLVTPNSTKEMEGYLDDLNEAMGVEKRGQKGRPKYWNYLNPTYLQSERQDYRDATGNSIGIAAQNNTFHSVSQVNYHPIDKVAEGAPAAKKALLGDLKIHLEHPKIRDISGQEKTTYSGTHNAVGNYISDFISQNINGAVDAVKDKWLIELIKNKDLLSTTLFLGRVGVHPKHIFFFVNQPAVQEFMRQQTILKSVRGINEDITGYANDKDVLEVVNKILGDLPFESQHNDFTLKELTEGLGAYKTGKDLNELSLEQRKFQKQILHEFVKYKTLADDSLTDQMASISANMSKTDSASVAVKNKRIEKAKEQSSLGVTRRITAHGSIGDLHTGMYDVVKQTEKAVSTTLTPVANSSVLEHIKEEFTDLGKYISDDTRRNILNKATISLLDFAIHTKSEMAGKPIGKYLKDALETDKVIQQLRSLRKTSKGDLKKLLDVVLRDLQPDNRAPKEIKNLKLWKKPKGVEADIFTDGLRELRDNPITHDLYKKLVLTSFLQSGLADSRISFQQYIPHEDVEEIVMQQAQAITLTPEQFATFDRVNAFYRNMWNDNDIVPLVKKVEDQMMGGKYFRYFSTKNTILGDRIGIVLKSYGENKAFPQKLQEPKFLTRSSKYNANDLNYPFLKTNEVGIDPDSLLGEEYTPQQQRDMRDRGDFSYSRPLLFQRVMEMGGPYIHSYDSVTGEYVYLYKQVNAWGDGTRAQEYHDTAVHSDLFKHAKVVEFSDADIINAVKGESYPKPAEEQQKAKDYAEIPTFTMKEQNSQVRNQPDKKC